VKKETQLGTLNGLTNQSGMGPYAIIEFAQD